MKMQSLVRAIYPAQCVACDAQTEAEHGLCGTCWRDTWFIHGTCCDTCGMPLPGQISRQRYAGRIQFIDALVFGPEVYGTGWNVTQDGTTGESRKMRTPIKGTEARGVALYACGYIRLNLGTISGSLCNCAAANNSRTSSEKAAAGKRVKSLLGHLTCPIKEILTWFSLSYDAN